MDEAALQIAVLGAAECDEHVADLAYRVGEGLARAGATIVCGGRGGVMAAACKGAHARGGTTLGILPGISAADSPPNDYLSVVVYTGMGQARNLAVALSGQAAIAVSGAWGTLSEMALALKHEVPVVSLESWRPDRPGGYGDGGRRTDPRLHAAYDPDEAVALALLLAGERL